MSNYYEYLKSKPIYYSIIVYGFIFLVFLKFFMDVWGYNYILKYKSNNPENIVEGCAYYSGKSKSKYNQGYYIVVNGYVYDTQFVLIHKFPSGLTLSNFEKDIDKDHFSCHKIKYVELNLILTRKIFIYDYVLN
ncbi:MAG: hypothetical protein E6Q89_05620 [Bacteroidia bacterium]|nr:MAG: hypothetical protein E6Q89_05620 [Bacteroidia bacterium]